MAQEKKCTEMCSGCQEGKGFCLTFGYEDCLLSAR